MSTIRQLPERPNRGKRTRELIGEEKEIDDIFWKTNSLFVDEADDEDYELESEKEDRFDEDFWKSETEEEAEEEVKEEEPQKKEKKPNKVEGKKKHKPIKRAKNCCKQSQQELLEEAATTEMWNQHKLTQMMQLEETKVQRFGNAGRKIFGPVIKMVDSMRTGRRKVSLHYSPDCPVIAFPQIPKPVPGAKYKDPRSGLEFSNSSDFKRVRSIYENQQEAALQLRIKELKETLGKKTEQLSLLEVKHEGH